MALSNSFLSYNLVYVIACVGREAATAIDEKKVLFDAAATFYCRALTNGSQNVSNDMRIHNASTALNQVEDWLTKWRHNVVMHEFCVQRGFLMCPTNTYDDIKVVKYAMESNDSVDERLKVAQELSVYRIRDMENQTADFTNPASTYTITPSEPKSENIPFSVLTVQSLVNLDCADLQSCKDVFKKLWSLLLIQDMLKEAINCIVKYQNSVIGASRPSPVHRKVFEIAYLMKAASLLYATHSSGHLTVQLEISQLVGDIRAGGGHGSVERGFFEWSGTVSENATQEEITQHLFGNIILPSEEEVATIKAEALTLFTAAQNDANTEKCKLLTMIDLKNSSRSGVTIPVGLSEIYLNGPRRNTAGATAVPNPLDFVDDDMDDVFGSLFE